MFYSKNGRGAVIVCIIYTTGYKTPLCHSPESTYRCGCTVYKHMYCNKIILRAWLPNDTFWDFPRKLAALRSLCVKAKASTFLTGTVDIFFLNQSLSWQIVLIFAPQPPSQPGVCLCQTSEPFQWVLWLISESLDPLVTFFFVVVVFVVVVYFSLSIHSKCLAYLCKYLSMHCAIFSKKKKSQQHKHRQCKCKRQACNAESPFAKCMCAPLFTRNRGVCSRHHPGQATSYRWINVVWLTC